MTPSFADIKSYVEAAFNAPWWALAAVFTFAVCVVLRRSSWFPNSGIPTVCLLTCSVLTMLLAPVEPSNFKAFGWRLTNFLIGGILGAMVWAFHAVILKRLAAKFPWLDTLLHGDGGDAPVPNPALTPPPNGVKPVPVSQSTTSNEPTPKP